ncbi:MAG: polysaccharide deacetylase family protein [Bacteroidota bacterium]
MAAPEIAVLSSHRHPRLRYILGEAGRMLGYQFRLFTEVGGYLKAEVAARINYGYKKNEIDEVHLFAHPFMLGKAPQTSDLVSSAWSTQRVGKSLTSNFKVAELPEISHVFFTNPAGNDFDPLAIAFFCLSRYEEYQAFATDQHGRFPATASHAQLNGYLHRPIVNEQFAYLATSLKGVFPKLSAPTPPSASISLTYDIDLPYAYRLRSWRGLASGVRDLFTGYSKRTIERVATLLRLQTDPYDVFDQLRELHETITIRPTLFWLLAEKRSSFNPNPSPQQHQLRALIQQTTSWADVGIHPSYYSSEKPELIDQERQQLIEISEQSVRHSRQHFLRFRLPITYRDLIRAGITHDHSMGYADDIGWRAGTNHPFYWYDLEKEAKTHLLIHPFAAMDVTLLRYKKLAASEVSLILHNLRTTTIPYGGPFELLWHNSSFASQYGWAGWWDVYKLFCTELLNK